MGVLQYNSQRPAQRVLFDLPDVDAVVHHTSALNVIKPVDEVGYGGLACAGGAYKGDFLSGLCIEADLLQHRMAGVIAEIHLIKPHISPQGDIGPVSLLPGPPFTALPCVRRLHQIDLSIVDF